MKVHAGNTNLILSVLVTFFMVYSLNTQDSGDCHKYTTLHFCNNPTGLIADCFAGTETLYRSYTLSC